MFNKFTTYIFILITVLCFPLIAEASSTPEKTITAVHPDFTPGSAITVIGEFDDYTATFLGIPPLKPILIKVQGEGDDYIEVKHQSYIKWKILEAPNPALKDKIFPDKPTNFLKGTDILQAQDVLFYGGTYPYKYPYTFAEGVEKTNFKLKYNGPRLYAFRPWDTDINDSRARTIHALKVDETEDDIIKLKMPDKLEIKKNLQYPAAWRTVDISALPWELASQPAGGTIPLGTNATAFATNYPAGFYTYKLNIDTLDDTYDLSKLATKQPIVKVYYSGTTTSPSDFSIATIPYDSTYKKQIVSNYANFTIPVYFASLDFSSRYNYINTRVTNKRTGNVTTLTVPVTWTGSKVDNITTYTPTLDEEAFYHYPIPETLKTSDESKIKVAHLNPWFEHNFQQFKNKTITLGKPIDTALSLPVNITFPTATPHYTDYNNPYRNTLAKYNLSSISYNGSVVTTVNHVGEYTLTYSLEHVVASKMQALPYSAPDAAYDAPIYFYNNSNFPGRREYPEAIVPTGCNYPQNTFTVTLTVTDGEFPTNTITKIADLHPTTIMQVYNKETISSTTFATSIPSTIDIDFYRLSPTPPGYFTKSIDIDWLWNTTNLKDFDLNTSEVGSYVFTAKFTDSLYQEMALKSGVVMPNITIKLVEGDPSAGLEKVAPQAWAMPAFYGNPGLPIPAIYFIEEGKEYALIDPLDSSKTLEIDYSWYNNVYNSMMMANTGETAIELLTKVDSQGKTVVYGIKGKEAGSDFFFNGGDKIIWVFTIDKAKEQEPKFNILKNHTSEYFQNDFKHSIDIDKTATWLDQTINDALVTFNIEGTKLNVPNNADIIMILDTSSSMNEKISNVPSSSNFYGKTYFEAAQYTLKSLAKLFMGRGGENTNNIRMALVAFGNDTHTNTNFVNNLTDFEKAVDSARVYPNSSTGSTPAIIQAYAYLASRTYTDRLPIMYFITDGNPTMYYDQRTLYPGKQVFTMNYMYTENFIINELNTYYSVRKGLTTVKTPTTLLKDFDNTEDGFSSFNVGTTTYDDFINMVISPFIAATNTVLTDIIAKDWEFDSLRASTLMDKYPTTTIVNNDNNTQTVTIPLGNVDAGDTFKIEIPIRLKQSTIDAQVPDEVFYPTNKSPETPKAANITYKRFDFKHMEINDAGVVGDKEDMNNDNDGNPIATPELPWDKTLPRPTPTPAPAPPPQTGDSSNIPLLVWLVMISVGSIIVFVSIKNKMNI